MVAMWMIFSETASLLLARGETPRFYECMMIEGASDKNDKECCDYLRDGIGVTSRGQSGQETLAIVSRLSLSEEKEEGESS